MSLSRPLIHTKSKDPKTANGTAVTTAKGINHLSYCAASIKNTKISPSAKDIFPAPELVTS